MARSYARVMSSIWTDPEFVKLGHTAQWAYLMLLSQPKLSLAGALDYMPRRWAKLGDIDEAELDGAIVALEQSRFVVVDYDTDELLIRTFVKHDSVTGGTKYENGVRAAIDAIQSEKLRALVEEALSERASSDRKRAAEPPSGPPSEPPSEPGPDHHSAYRGENREQRTETESREPRAARPAADLDGFDEFWDQYPRRDGKRIGRGDAEKVWARMSAHKRTLALQAVTNYAQSGRMPQDAHRWLRDERWDDWQTPAVPAVASTSIADNPTIRRLRQNGVPALGRVVEY